MMRALYSPCSRSTIGAREEPAVDVTEDGVGARIGRAGVACLPIYLLHNLYCRKLFGH
jgi:hypothetical protein